MAKDIKVAVVRFNMCYNFITELYNLSSDVAHSQATPNQLNSFRVKYADINRMRDQFESNFSVLSAHTEDSNEKEQLEKRFSQFYDMFYSIQTVKCDVPSCSGTSESKLTEQVHTSQGPKFHLPKITLSSFKGVHTEWANFISIYNSLIHDNTELSNIHKFHYLLSVLEHEPLNLIKHLTISNENYVVAYKLLQDRYENKRLIAEKHLDLLLSISCQGGVTYKNIRRIVNTLKENVQALKALGFDVDSWSFLLFYITTRKLPIELRTKFEFTLKLNEIPSFNNLLEFLENHLRVLETTGVSNNPKPTINVATVLVSNGACLCCGGNHSIYQCSKFESLENKQAFVSEHKLCFNCLRPHYVTKCLSKSCCYICKGRHHTKLHSDISKSAGSSMNLIRESADSSMNLNRQSADSSMNLTSKSADSSGNSKPSRQVLLNTEPLSMGLLGTALVGVQDIEGNVHVVRSLIDPGAQSSLMTESLAQRLRLHRHKSCDLFGVGAQRQPTHGKVHCEIKSLTNSEFSGLSIECIVLKRITGHQPATPICPLVPEMCKELQLADKSFNVPGRIDLLLGVDLFDDVFNGPKQKLGNNLPTAHSTIFGWVIMGSIPVTSTHYQNLSLLASESRLEVALNKFWESEESSFKPIQDPDDIMCEKHFVVTHSRDSNGKFVVRLPFKVNATQLGDTYLPALKRFYNLERKLTKQPQLRELYINFMRDYIEAGHMRPISLHTDVKRYHIPHHGVLKDSSSTTKLRAVFDASLPSSTGVSLNQILMSGPKLQEDIQDIILRFRTYKVVFTCDIKQMYRNVRMHDADCPFQTIFWRESPDQPLQEFELTTVTYGVTSSAYQAIRVIQELASINDSTYPDAARILREDIFVDDIVSGSATIEGAKVLQQQVCDVLAQGGFQLRKWSSNSKNLLNGLPSDHHEKPFRFEDSGDNIFKILGIEWNPSSDEFLYRVGDMNKTFTKRGILSDIARLYDPCGFITPVTFFAKAFMQKLWLLNLDWDDPLPAELHRSWSDFVNDFTSLNQISIPRLVLDQPSECQLHGFSDASERGYAACVYLRVSAGGNVESRLLLAKSRVAPIKQRQTIPKLELCGALLLSRILKHTYNVLQSKIQIASITAWSDSTIVLTWLQTSPHRLQIFEGNRVSQVQGLLPNATWRYVTSALNPADVASRGILPCELINHNLWWCPSWLNSDPGSWPDTCQLVDGKDLPGVKSPATVLVQTVETPDIASTLNTDSVRNLIQKFSSLNKLKTVLGLCLRFIHNVRNPEQKRTGHLTLSELNNALFICVRSVQASAFAEPITLLRTDKPTKGTLSRLNPFLDNDGLLRVGGRLINADLPYASKHPILLPHSHHLTHLIVDHYHQLYGHAGPAILMANLQGKFWILSARRVVRHRIFKCQRCYRLKAKPLNPFMGNLPASRITQVRAFQRVGVDFAGPFTVKDSKLRKPKTFKSYLCVFICFVTKAVHLEVVSDLSTEAFLACLDRFVSRRGLPSDIFSDCGTNFVGARNYLKEIYNLKTELFKDSDKIQHNLAPREIVWHLNAPSGPHLGGLWESAVKSCKTQLKRIVGQSILTFEELCTVFSKVEAILNSRPICPLSSDPNDLEVLTPGHFLIGQPLLSLPERLLTEVSAHRLSRWQLLHQITQHFWQRWHKEYLHTLQQRSRWLKPQRNMEVGDLVLLIDSHLSPLQWRRARVVRLFPGSDGVVRVVEIKTSTGTLVRPVVKLCRLLHEN